MKLWQSAALWVVLHTVGFLVTMLPRALERVLGRALGRFLLRLGGSRVRIASENLAHCYAEMGQEERARLLKAHFEHLGTLALELLHLFSPVPGHYRRYLSRIGRLEGFENWKAANAKGKGIIFLSSHMGNWECMVGSGALGGIPLTMVTKQLKPEWLHRKVESARLSAGVKGAYEPRTLPVVMRALRNGESVGFVMDQYAGPPMGIPVPFFGVKVGTLAAVSVLVERTGAAVVPVHAIRGDDGILRTIIEPEMELGAVASDNEKCTAALTAHVEGWVREQPDQWYWIHRRFKNVVWPQRIP